MTSNLKRYMRVVEASLLSNPQWVLSIPANSYEFYKLLLKLTNPHGPTPAYGIHDDPGASPEMWLVFCTPQEYEECRDCLDDWKIPYKEVGQNPEINRGF